MTATCSTLLTCDGRDCAAVLDLPGNEGQARRTAELAHGWGRRWGILAYRDLCPACLDALAVQETLRRAEQRRQLAAARHGLAAPPGALALPTPQEETRVHLRHP